MGNAARGTQCQSRDQGFRSSTHNCHAKTHLDFLEDIIDLAEDISADCSSGPAALLHMYSAAVVGHTVDGYGELECSLRVTHAASKQSWDVHRQLRDWLLLEEQLWRESHLRSACHSTASSPSSLPPRLGPGRCVQPRKTHKQRRAPTEAELARWQTQVEDLQAKLSDQLRDKALRTSCTLHRFLDVQPPEVPSLVRISRLQLDPLPSKSDRSEDTSAIECSIEVHTQDWKKEDSTSVDVRALPTHIVAKAFLINSQFGENGVEPWPERGEPIRKWVVPSSALVQIAAGGLHPGIAYELVVHSLNAVGKSSGVAIRVLVPAAAVLMASAPAHRPLTESRSSIETSEMPSVADGSDFLNFTPSSFLKTGKRAGGGGAAKVSANNTSEQSTENGLWIAKGAQTKFADLVTNGHAVKQQAKGYTTEPVHGPAEVVVTSENIYSEGLIRDFTSEQREVAQNHSKETTNTNPGSSTAEFDSAHADATVDTVDRAELPKHDVQFCRHVDTFLNYPDNLEVTIFPEDKVRGNPEEQRTGRSEEARQETKKEKDTEKEHHEEEEGEEEKEQKKEQEEKTEREKDDEKEENGQEEKAQEMRAPEQQKPRDETQPISHEEVAQDTPQQPEADTMLDDSEAPACQSVHAADTQIDEEVASRLSDGGDSFQSVDADMDMQEGYEGTSETDTKNALPQADDRMPPEDHRESMHSACADQDTEHAAHDVNDESVQGELGQGAAQAYSDGALDQDEQAKGKQQHPRCTAALGDGHGGTLQEAHAKQMQGIVEREQVSEHGHVDVAFQGQHALEKAQEKLWAGRHRNEIEEPPSKNCTSSLLLACKEDVRHMHESNGSMECEDIEKRFQEEGKGEEDGTHLRGQETTGLCMARQLPAAAPNSAQQQPSDQHSLCITPEVPERNASGDSQARAHVLDERKEVEGVEGPYICEAAQAEPQRGNEDVESYSCEQTSHGNRSSRLSSHAGTQQGQAQEARVKVNQECERSPSCQEEVPNLETKQSNVQRNGGSEQLALQTKLAEQTAQADRKAAEQVDLRREALKVFEASPQPKAPAARVAKPGCTLVAGFNVRLASMPEGAETVDLEHLVQELQARAAKIADISTQQAVRLLLGCNLEIQTSLERLQEVKDWRRRRDMDRLHTRLVTQMRASEPVQFPGHEEVSKLMFVNPCSLVTKDGCPVSIFHVGGANAGAAAGIADESLAIWSSAVFEYTSAWISEHSERTGQLVGQIQIFNLQGLSFWQVSSSVLIDKLKLALGAGKYYVENVSHIYVVNSGSVFSMAWRVIKNLITPRTASKITVTGDVPQDLLSVLRPGHAKSLPQLLKKPQPLPIQRPPAT